MRKSALTESISPWHALSLAAILGHQFMAAIRRPPKASNHVPSDDRLLGLARLRLDFRPALRGTDTILGSNRLIFVQYIDRIQLIELEPFHSPFVQVSGTGRVS